MPTIYEWVGRQELQFGLSNNMELKPLLKKTWIDVSPDHKVQVDDPSILGFVSSYFCRFFGTNNCFVYCRLRPNFELIAVRLENELSMSSLPRRS